MGSPTGPTIAKDGTEDWLMLGQTLNFLGGQLRQHHRALDQTGWKASGGQASERPEATWLQPPQQDLRVKYRSAGLQLRELGGRNPGQALSGFPLYTLPDQNPQEKSPRQATQRDTLTDLCNEAPPG